jgi:prephenate dehydrogenase
MKIAVIGLGLIGGSLAKAIKSRTAHTLFGQDTNETVLCRAELTGAIDARLDQKGLAACDVVILALYPRDALKTLGSIAPDIKKQAVVLDTCGVKRSVVPAAQSIARENGFYFVGAHPMAGIERAGFAFSRHNLFENASMILTPCVDVPIGTLEQLKALSLDMGFSQVRLTTPEQHDRVIAYTSQLAHVVSSAYVQSPAALEHRGFSAGSYRDMTRVATLNETMWTELFLDNCDNLAGEIDALIGRLERYSRAIRQQDAQTLCALLREGREQKARADGKELCGDADHPG